MPPKRKSKWVPKPKNQQQQQVKKATRNWLELPSELMPNILHRIGVVDILESAQKVCTVWRDICKDPATWRVVYMDRFSSPLIENHVLWEMFKCAVDRSRGQLVDLTVVGFCDDELLDYVADRSSQLRRLEVVYHLSDIHGISSVLLEKLSALEELSLVRMRFQKHNIEAVGRHCPLLKILKLNQEAFRHWKGNEDDATSIQNEIAIAIGENLPGLTHLELVGNSMQNIGLEAILDGCCHLESLDLRRCLHLDLKGDLGKRCSKQVKNLRLPHESLEGWPYGHEDDNVNNIALGLIMFG